MTSFIFLLSVCFESLFSSGKAREAVWPFVLIGLADQPFQPPYLQLSSLLQGHGPASQLPFVLIGLTLSNPPISNYPPSFRAKGAVWPLVLISLANQLWGLLFFIGLKQGARSGRLSWLVRPISSSPALSPFLSICFLWRDSWPLIWLPHYLATKNCTMLLIFLHSPLEKNMQKIKNCLNYLHYYIIIEVYCHRYLNQW